MLPPQCNTTVINTRVCYDDITYDQKLANAQNTTLQASFISQSFHQHLKFNPRFHLIQRLLACSLYIFLFSDTTSFKNPFGLFTSCNYVHRGPRAGYIVYLPSSASGTTTALLSVSIPLCPGPENLIFLVVQNACGRNSNTPPVLTERSSQSRQPS